MWQRGRSAHVAGPVLAPVRDGIKEGGSGVAPQFRLLREVRVAQGHRCRRKTLGLRHSDPPCRRWRSKKATFAFLHRNDGPSEGVAFPSRGSPGGPAPPRPSPSAPAPPPADCNAFGKMNSLAEVVFPFRWP
ncbi:hypothetical protein VULLAG_LOCUS7684 [Vulpes lagopus]